MNNFRRGDAEFPPKPIDMTEPRSVVAAIAAECLSMGIDTALPQHDREAATEVGRIVMQELLGELETLRLASVAA